MWSGESFGRPKVRRDSTGFRPRFVLLRNLRSQSRKKNGGASHPDPWVFHSAMMHRSGSLTAIRFLPGWRTEKKNVSSDHVAADCCTTLSDPLLKERQCVKKNAHDIGGCLGTRNRKSRGPRPKKGFCRLYFVYVQQENTSMRRNAMSETPLVRETRRNYSSSGSTIRQHCLCFETKDMRPPGLYPAPPTFISGTPPPEAHGQTKWVMAHMPSVSESDIAP